MVHVGEDCKVPASTSPRFPLSSSSLPFQSSTTIHTSEVSPGFVSSHMHYERTGPDNITYACRGTLFEQGTPSHVMYHEPSDHPHSLGDSQISRFSRYRGASSCLPYCNLRWIANRWVIRRNYGIVWVSISPRDRIEAHVSRATTTLI